MNKQTRDGIVLGVLLLVLVVFAVFSLRNTNQNGNQPPVQSTVQRDKTASTEKAASTEPTLSWVHEDRLPVLMASARGGRDPFYDHLAPEQMVTRPDPRPVNNPGPIIPTGSDRPLPTFGQTPFVVDQTRTETFVLLNTTKAEVQQALAAENLDVTWKFPAANKLTITGADDDLAAAVAMVERMNTPEAAPPVTLTGVILAHGQRMAAFTTADGRYCSLEEGETLPGYGWVVKSITSSAVVLKKKNQSVTLRMSGGNAQ